MNKTALEQMRAWVKAEIRLALADGDRTSEWLMADAEFSELLRLYAGPAQEDADEQ